MVIVTSLPSNLLLHHGEGLVSIQPTNEPEMALFLGTPGVARETARAILAALGEPVGGKLDRSELDKVVPWRFIAVEDETREMTRFGRVNADLDGLVSMSKEDTARALTIYEAIAHIASKPEPAERKVVRVL